MAEEVHARALFIYRDDQTGSCLTVAVGQDNSMVITLDGDLIEHRPGVPDPLASLRAIVGLITREGLDTLTTVREAVTSPGGGF